MLRFAVMEGTMSTMSLDVIGFRPRRASLWSEVKYSFADWRHRIRSRNELMNLDERA
jgi:uncharacterized protein YjiS (DUF1127 family)